MACGVFLQAACGAAQASDHACGTSDIQNRRLLRISSAYAGQAPAGDVQFQYHTYDIDLSDSRYVVSGTLNGPRGLSDTPLPVAPHHGTYRLAAGGQLRTTASDGKRTTYSCTAADDGTITLINNVGVFMKKGGHASQTASIPFWNVFVSRPLPKARSMSPILTRTHLPKTLRSSHAKPTHAPPQGRDTVSF